MSNRLYAELNTRIINEDVRPEVDVTLEETGIYEVLSDAYQKYINFEVN